MEDYYVLFMNSTLYQSRIAWKAYEASRCNMKRVWRKRTHISTAPFKNQCYKPTTTTATIISGQQKLYVYWYGLWHIETTRRNGLCHFYSVLGLILMYIVIYILKNCCLTILIDFFLWCYHNVTNLCISKGNVLSPLKCFK